MAIELFINFTGNCREAVEFYAEVFKTEAPQIMTYGDTPAQSDQVFPMFEEMKDKIMCASLNIKGTNVMFQDVFPGMPVAVGDNVNLTLTLDSKEEVQAIFEALKEGGAVGMELQETFWSKYYGAVKDKFGLCWQFNYIEKAS